MKLPVQTLGFFLVLLFACQPKEKETAESLISEADLPELSEADKMAYQKKGQEIAQASFQALSAQVMAAMKRGGVPEALSYCNVSAMPLTDSLASVHQAEITRRALKTRNPANRPNERENTILEAYREKVEAGEQAGAQVELLPTGELLFTTPILLLAQCIQCHGKPNEEISPENLAIINELYPEDQAVGFEPGSLRGMWAIRFTPQDQ